MDLAQSEEIRLMLSDERRELQQQVGEQAKQIENLWDTIIEHAKHIEKLEAALELVSKETNL